MTNTNPNPELAPKRYAIRMLDASGHAWYIDRLQPLTSPSWTDSEQDAKTWASASAARRRAIDHGMLPEVFDVVVAFRPKAGAR